MLTEKEQRFLKSYTAAELRRLAKDLVAAADVVEAWAARRRQSLGKLRVAKSEIERFADERESGLRCLPDGISVAVIPACCTTIK